MAKYRQALLETVDGLWLVSVSTDIQLNEGGRIANPKAVFDDGSTIVAVEQGVLPDEELVEHPNPFDEAQAASHAKGNGGKPEPRRIKGKGPRYGAFCVQHTGQGVALEKSRELGEFVG